MRDRSANTAWRGIPVIGSGARTPLGFNAPATAAAVRAGITMLKEHAYMVNKYGEPMVVSSDYELPPEMDGIERLVQLAVPAVVESLSTLRNRETAVPPISLFIALPERRPGRPENLVHRFTSQLNSLLEKQFRVQGINCCESGHAGGIICMERALDQIMNGHSELCLVGGVDSYLSADTLEWLDSLDQLHSESTIYGFCPGEGAGFCLLASQRFADQFGLSASVALMSAASAFEPNRIKTNTICIGEGLSEAFRKTLTALPKDTRIDHTICDMNGERYRGNEYGFAMLRCGQNFGEESNFETPADCWGDVGAASGPLFCILASFAALKSYAHGPFTFIWASSEGGHRAAALLQATTYDKTRKAYP